MDPEERSRNYLLRRRKTSVEAEGVAAFLAER